MGHALKLVFLGLFMSYLISNLSAQDKYWVATQDTSHLPLNPTWCTSWLSYCVYNLTEDQIQKIHKEIALIPVQSFAVTQINAAQQYGFALEQIEAQLLIEKGWTGKNIKLGIIDGGFLNAPSHPALQSHFKQERIAYYKDYITPDLPAYEGSHPLDDGHGTDVWNLIGGHQTTLDISFGIAQDASYYLARTDHGAYEKRMEEDLLIKALEDFHSMGVRLVNVSLGYADGYTRKNENYRPQQMDGKTTLLTQAINKAYLEKDMLVVVSAGNEGQRPGWRVLSAPADAAGALSVGASILSGTAKMKYSSIGTPGLGYIKPEVICFASNGTSFSAPVITGLAAAIMQIDSSLSAKEIKDLIIQSSTLYPYGNNHMGYGVPKVSRLLKLMNNEPLENLFVVDSTNRSLYKIDKPTLSESISIFHKNENSEVIQQQSFVHKKELLKVKRPDDCKQSTVLIGDRAYEIYWQ